VQHFYLVQPIGEGINDISDDSLLLQADIIERVCLITGTIILTAITIRYSSWCASGQCKSLVWRDLIQEAKQ
jgi:hypothetical protein